MRIVIAGDYCESGRVKDVLETTHDSLISSELCKEIEFADIASVNFEFPIIDNITPKPISKRGPHLFRNKESIRLLRNAGFNLCTLANNHILDQGEECCLHTKELLEINHISTVGVGENMTEASRTKCLSIHDETVAIINCCEHEFSIATDNSAGANPINPIQQYYAIKYAKEKVDYVVVIVHGGIEHYQLPTPRMKEIYRFFIDAGADSVVNHHQHCYSGYEIYKGKPIFYGLGNFLFDWEGKRNCIWNEGYMVSLVFFKTKVDFRLIPYTQCNERVIVSPMTDSETTTFYSKIELLNAIIQDDDELKKCHENRMAQETPMYRLLLQPYSSRIAKWLYNRGLLPSVITEYRRLGYIDYLECESHLERMLYTLKTMKK